MKVNYSTLIAVTFAFLFTGCTSFQEFMDADRTERLASRLESVAFSGTVLVLRNNPGHQAIFEEVHEELVEQEGRDGLTYETLVGILRKLPIDELKGDDAFLYVEGGRAIFSPTGGEIIDLGQTGESIHVLAGGIRRGIERGLAW